ncbi:hypothetical protein CBR_g46307 [Chara braunii]|uniref:protein O-GlcNAc transferase n=1 Tax=Chara braunii TaxID=69332 RepID=A0A388M083_CHABU|nr:hypothetical protein CBR_g46307 [Chara braunii]|eukprot:GBG87941.1 hypothetical protein CBR_g46307 [Chara braunii]
MISLQNALIPYQGHGLYMRDQIKTEDDDRFIFPHATQSPSDGSEVTSVTSDDSLFNLAHQEYKNRHYAEALQFCLRVYEHSPKRTDVLLLLGAIYYQLQQYDQCIAKNDEAIRLDPRFAECYGNKANALKEKGDVDLAIHFYLTAIQLRPAFCDAWSNLASAYMRKGMLQQAADCCQRALQLNPNLVDAHSNLGNLLKAQGLPQHAYYCYMKALTIQPDFAIAWSNLGGLFMEAMDFQAALGYYKEAIRLKPDFADAHLNQGNVLKALGQPQEAIACYQRALELRPDFAIAYGNLASVYYEQGHINLAIDNYGKAIQLDSTFLEAYNNLGNALKDVGRSHEATVCYRRCLELDPNHPQALTNLGNMYMESNMTKEAQSYYLRTLMVTKGLSAPYSNLATIYKLQGRFEDAIECYNHVIRIDPLAAEPLVNRGNTLKDMGKISEAINDYLAAVRVRPTIPEGHANLASAYKDSGLPEMAIKSYQDALSLKPDFPEAYCNLLHTLQGVCDWEDRDEKFAQLEEVVRKQIKMDVLPSMQPFHAIAYPIDALLALEVSMKYADHCLKNVAAYQLPPFEHPLPIPVKAPGGSGRLRVGYVSSDFGNHPLSHLMGSVFGLHDSKRVEAFCYALSPSDRSEWRERIQTEAEHFLDVSSLDAAAIARRIQSDGIQILVNLNGYTKGARNEIFALQPAPIQVSYMGFPSTTGASYIQYLITDEIVSPPRYAHYYSEKLAYLPHCYFVNDYKRCNMDVLDANKLPKRSDYGLPEDRVLYCCFNQLYKTDPNIFARWCNILKRVPNSALWLLRFPESGESRLRAAAMLHGVKADQLYFTDVALKPDHLKRSALGDVFLDTPLCNAHTTGTDVLWAGCPMVTLPLEKMATRVASSLCIAAGLKECVVSSEEEYEERAVMLGLNADFRYLLKRKLRNGRLTCPLFDTQRWVCNLERVLFNMWRLHCNCEPPQSFKVTEDEEAFPRE